MLLPFYLSKKTEHFFHPPTLKYFKSHRGKSLPCIPTHSPNSQPYVPVFSYRFPPGDGYNLGEWSGGWWWGGVLSVPRSSTHYQMFRGRPSLRSGKTLSALSPRTKASERRGRGRYIRSFCFDSAFLTSAHGILTEEWNLKYADENNKRSGRFFTILSKQERKTNPFISVSR